MSIMNTIDHAVGLGSKHISLSKKQYRKLIKSGARIKVENGVILYRSVKITRWM